MSSNQTQAAAVAVIGIIHLFLLRNVAAAAALDEPYNSFVGC